MRPRSPHVYKFLQNSASGRVRFGGVKPHRSQKSLTAARNRVKAFADEADLPVGEPPGIMPPIDLKAELSCKSFGESL